jgi:hypothetical protein
MGKKVVSYCCRQIRYKIVPVEMQIWNMLREQLVRQKDLESWSDV